MYSNKLEGRFLRGKCESTSTTNRKTPGIPVPSSKKPCLSNRTAIEIPTPSFGRNVRKVHNCLAPELKPVAKTTKSRLKRKSVSLVELSLTNKIQTPRKWQSREHGDEMKISRTSENKGGVPNFNSSREFELAKKVCKAFFLHAWRRRRCQVQELQQVNQKLVNENGNLQVQTRVLRNLLDSEQVRVAVATCDSAHLKQRLEMELKTLKEKTEVLNRLEAEKLSWEVSCSQMTSEVQFLSESLTAETAKVQDLNEKCIIYEQDLNVLKDNEMELQDKLAIANHQLKYSMCLIKEIEKKNAEFETQVADLTSAKNLLVIENENKMKKINVYCEKIKLKDKEISSFQQLRKVLEDNVENLEKEIAMKSEEIERKESAIMSLENIINDHEMEQEKCQQNITRVRNKVVFEAIKFSASLFLPKPSSMAI